VQVAAGVDVVDEVLPVGRPAATLRLGRRRGAVALALAGAPLCAAVAEVADEKLDDLVDQLLRFLGADVGQLLPRDLQ
jgi:hypothetical protein